MVVGAEPRQEDEEVEVAVREDDEAEVAVTVQEERKAVTVGAIAKKETAEIAEVIAVAHTGDTDAAGVQAKSAVAQAAGVRVEMLRERRSRVCRRNWTMTPAAPVTQERHNRTKQLHIRQAMPVFRETVTCMTKVKSEVKMTVYHITASTNIPKRSLPNTRNAGTRNITESLRMILVQLEPIRILFPHMQCN